MSDHQLNTLYLKTQNLVSLKRLKTRTYVSTSRKPSSGGVTQLHLLFKNCATPPEDGFLEAETYVGVFKRFKET
jgi:hypothetical protein